jgi:hypothetical protein
MLYTLDDEREDDALIVKYPYFETVTPISFNDAQSYVGTGTVEHSTTHEWNHGLGEILTALINAGLRIDLVHEHKCLDWQAMPSMTLADGR